MSSVLVNSAAENIYTFIRVSPPDGVTRGGPPPTLLVTPLKIQSVFQRRKPERGKVPHLAMLKNSSKNS